MTPEERLLRLENAFSTLSELAATSQARTDQVIALVRSMDERMDQHLTWINQLGVAQAEVNTKLAALTDAQIRTEQVLAAAQVETQQALAKLTERVSELVEAQAHTDRRVDALIDIVRERPGGQSQN